MTSLHNVKTIAAHTLPEHSALIIEFGTGNWEEGAAEIIVHSSDKVLSSRLAEAINSVMAQRKKELLCCIDSEAA